MDTVVPLLLLSELLPVWSASSEALVVWSLSDESESNPPAG